MDGGLGEEVIVRVVEKSLGLGYMVKQFRDGVGVVMRKSKKGDYSLPSSYRCNNPRSEGLNR